MALEKYPITTDRQEYRITIKPYAEWNWEDSYRATVYVREKSKFLMISKWIKVDEYTRRREGVDQIENGFIDFAKYAVRSYEKWLLEQEKIESYKDKFNQWDGDMREEVKADK